jgi:hypothetical protein
VEALAKEFFRQSKAAFDAEVERGLGRGKVVLEALAVPNISWSFFGVPYNLFDV